MKILINASWTDNIPFLSIPCFLWWPEILSWSATVYYVIMWATASLAWTLKGHGQPNDFTWERKMKTNWSQDPNTSHVRKAGLQCQEAEHVCTFLMSDSYVSEFKCVKIQFHILFSPLSFHNWKRNISTGRKKLCTFLVVDCQFDSWKFPLLNRLG